MAWGMPSKQQHEINYFALACQPMRHKTGCLLALDTDNPRPLQ